MLGIFLLLNVLIFACYRLVFLTWFARGTPLATQLQILISGFRLDSALLASEIFIIVAVFFFSRYLRPGRLCFALCIITLSHALACAGNLFVFQERNQQMGDLLMGYITSPRQIYLATIPFVSDHYVLTAVLLVSSAAFLYCSLLLRRRVEAEAWDMWKPGTRIIGCLLLLGLILLPVFEPVKVKKTRAAKGWKLQFCQSKYYTKMNGVVLNQAIMNPLQELLWVYLPAEFNQRTKYHLEEKAATNIARTLLGISGQAGEYPLVTHIKGEMDLGIESVIIVQVEGLSQFLVERKEHGHYVMPFLQRLSRENIYFPNTFQSFNATAGGIFSTVTGIHKESFNEQTQRFATYEMNGYYGGLPHILGSRGRHHYFFLGFVHSSADFIAFMQNQGYFTYDYSALKQSSDGKWQSGEVENALGLYDAFYLKTAADILVKTPGPFTAHLMTATTHSPWTIPESFPRRFSTPAFNAFAYTDAAIEAFFQRLRLGRQDFSRILIVILADHASITQNGQYLEGKRIPLLFCNPQFRQKSASLKPLTERLASQVDVLPTILALLGGNRQYAGFGRNLLAPAAIGQGVISGGRHEAIYLKKDAVFEYKPLEKAMRLYTPAADKDIVSDISAEQPKLLEQMKQEYFGLTETARRLAGQRKIFPLQDR